MVKRRKTKVESRLKEIALYACYRFRQRFSPVPTVDRYAIVRWSESMLQKNINAWLAGHSQPKDNCIEFLFPFNPLSPRRQQN